MGRKRYTRGVEARLLLLISLIYTGGILLVQYSRSGAIDNSLLLLSFPVLLAPWITHFLLKLERSKSDELLLPLTGFLCCVGHIEIYRLQPDLAMKQTLFIIAGFFLFNLWYLKGFDYRIWEDYKYIVLLAGILIQVAVMVLGSEINGVRLWFRIGSFSFQPVEIVKVIVVIFLASYLKQKKEFITSYPRKWLDALFLKYLIPLIIIWGCCELILIVQKDLGMAFLLFGTFMCLFYIATQRLGLILCCFILFFASSWALVHLFPHVQVRITSWLNPWQDPDGSGYQTLQALFSLAGGGFWGTGIGLGSPTFIPAVHTDYVFAAIGEELGFLGSFAIICIYLLLIQRIFRASMQALDEFGILLCAGLGSLLACQTFIIIGGTTKFIPMTGITLPFISYGGSSIIANFFILAIVFQVSSFSKKKHQAILQLQYEEVKEISGAKLA